MKISQLFISVLILVLFCETVDAQKVLLLQKPGKTKRFLYHTGDKISVRMGEPEFIVHGEISYIDDSLCTVDKNYTFQLSNVNEVIRTRSFLHHSWKMLYLTAGVYAAGSMINHGLNSETPVFDNTIPWVSGSFIVLGTTAYLLRYKHLKIEKGWNLKVLDFDIYEERTNNPE